MKHEHETWNMEHGTWNKEHGTWSIKHQTWVERGTWSRDQGTWSMEHGTWSMEHEAWGTENDRNCFFDFFWQPRVCSGSPAWAGLPCLRTLLSSPGTRLCSQQARHSHTGSFIYVQDEIWTWPMMGPLQIWILPGWWYQFSGSSNACFVHGDRSCWKYGRWMRHKIYSFDTRSLWR